jgi:trehalose synthase
VDSVLTALPEYAPRSVPAARRHVVAPAIDPWSAKNRPLAKDEIAALLGGIGLTREGPAGGFGRVEQDMPLPLEARMVLQVSRWDPLKDMPGVVRCVPGLPQDVHVVLAGNDPAEIPDDPEGASVFEEVRAARAELSGRDRARVHLVLPSARDGERAALVVNALQRRADVVLQKSLAEGFGLTVTEAMVKGRAVVAADVGGPRQQISPGHCGLLVNPSDTGAVVFALRTLLDDPLLRHRMGRRAAVSATRRYLLPRLVADYQRFVTPHHRQEVA